MDPVRALAVVVAVSSSLATAGPADACRCLTPSLARTTRAADVILVGTLTEVEITDHAIATVTVRAVWKGAVAETVQIHDSPTSCRRGLAAGTTLVIMARRDGDRLTVRQCDGTQAATPALERRLTRRLGAPHPPTP
ncbi:MAG: hypothetical protein IPL61_15920 [Myxococcales bacterium]|nr:hypothetical protein [Myxococcales bacterium]